MFYAVLKLFKGSPKQLLYLILFDALFIITIIVTDIFFKLMKPANIYLVLFIQVIHLLLFVFVYSFFKYCILHIITLFFNEKKFNFNRLLRFYYLNLILLIFALVIFYAMGFVYSLIIRPNTGAIVASVVFVIYALFIYIIIGISHSLFVRGFSLKQILKKTMVLLKRTRSYAGMILFSLSVLLIYTVLYNLITYILRYLYRDPNTVFLSGYFNFFSLVTLIILYLLIVFNMLYFYLIVKKSS